MQEPLEDGWARVRSLLARLGHEEPVVVAPAITRKRPARLEWLQVEETGLSVQLKNSEPALRDFRSEPRLAELAWELVRAVLERPEDSLQQAVQETEPACTMCGECCRLFAVEVTPSEVRELCAFLGLKRADFHEHYTIPGRFGWNPGNRILRKVPTPLYSKRLRELPLAAPEGQGVQCVFLERRPDGFFGCRVYSARPKPCRNFAPTSSLCRKTNSAVNPGRQAYSLRSLYLDAEAIRLYTARGHDAVRVPRGAWPEVEAAARELEAAVAVSPKRRRR
jgi:Fe-S-cluster containining protein